jgi:hypothetical protein
LQNFEANPIRVLVELAFQRTETEDEQIDPSVSEGDKAREKSHTLGQSDELFSKKLETVPRGDDITWGEGWLWGAATAHPIPKGHFSGTWAFSPVTHTATLPFFLPPINRASN